MTVVLRDPFREVGRSANGENVAVSLLSRFPQSDGATLSPLRYVAAGAKEGHQKATWRQRDAGRQRSQGWRRNPI